MPEVLLTRTIEESATLEISEAELKALKRGTGKLYRETGNKIIDRACQLKIWDDIGGSESDFAIYSSDGQHELFETT